LMCHESSLALTWEAQMLALAGTEALKSLKE
jgi:hypothetical protein